VSEFLTFTLGEERYGLDILRVREIRRYEGATALAGSAEFVKGVIDLRGVMVPIVDMRIRLRLASAACNELTVLIIVHVADKLLGLIVDGVSDVVGIAADEVKPVPQLAGASGAHYIAGLANLNGGMVILLDIDRFTGAAELEPLPEAEAA
jgi:purine-binding chemotaxis protein CheW